ncbi:ABC transporter permease [Terracidiphilus sp.]|jgi:putative ABC transport system permease protein|uniref:ABC transporter permease n=1 Tax=Terracidiphilus sp. TaxID=1964191 RepID=UPI003C286AA2
MMRDIRLAFRLFRRTPGPTGIALLSIALSVGATAVVFTAFRAVLLTPLPYAHPSELVQIRTEFPKFGPSHSDWALWSDAQEIAQRTRTLASVAVYRNEMFNLAGNGPTPPEALYGLRITANLFPALGVSPMLGRNILPDEDQPGHANEIILSYGLWVRRFNADPSIVGHSVSIDGQSCLILGVMPRGFDFPLRRAAVHTPSPYVDFWAPYRSGKSQAPYAAVGVVARLQSGVSLNDAQQDLATISADLSRELPATNRDHILHIGLLRDRMLGNAKDALWVLMAAAVMFLLIGCANVANLLLARGLARQREITVRMALGASRWRIIRQLLTESCVLAALGGVGGYIFTVVAWRALPGIAPVNVPRLGAAHADWQILVFSLVVALANGLLFGMVPAMRAGWTQANANQGLRSHGGIVTSNRVRGALVAIEVALALALVVVGGQLLASFATLLRTDPGFDAKRVTAFIIVRDSVRYQTPEEWGTFYRRALDSVRALPGIESAGTNDALPFSGENTGGLVGRNAGGASQGGQIAAEIDDVSAGYLQTMGIRLLQGRLLNEEDMSDASDAAIVSDFVAKRLWPGESAIGKPVCVFCSPEDPNHWKRVVGVVSSSRHASMDGPQQQATVYLAASALPKAAFLVVRSDRPGIEVQRAVRQAIAGIDSNQPIFLSATMQALIDDSLADRRFIMLLLALTGCLALAMAAAGVYGVATYVTSRRTQEIGIRIALGATRGSVEALIFRQGFVTAMIGLASGLGITLALMRILRGMLPGLESGQSGGVWIEVALVALTAAVGCWLPARRAAKIDPMLAIRQE